MAHMQQILKHRMLKICITMSNNNIKKFPYSDYDVVIVEMADILKTIDDNIIDKDVAKELISSLEVTAYNHLKEEKGVSFPYFGTVRIPDGLTKENRLRNRDAINLAYETMDKARYVAFIKDMSKLNKERIKFRSLHENVFEIMKRKYPDLYRDVYKEKGELLGKFYITYLFFMKPSKQIYERELDGTVNEEDYGEIYD